MLARAAGWQDSARAVWINRLVESLGRHLAETSTANARDLVKFLGAAGAVERLVKGCKEAIGKVVREFTPEEDRALIQAGAAGDLAEVKRLVDSGVDVNAVDMVCGWKFKIWRSY